MSQTRIDPADVKDLKPLECVNCDFRFTSLRLKKLPCCPLCGATERMRQRDYVANAAGDE